VAGVTWAAEVLEEEGVFDDQRLPTVTVLPVLAALYKSLPTKLDDYANARRGSRTANITMSFLIRCFVVTADFPIEKAVAP